mgnify:CR=1 FL=1
MAKVKLRKGLNPLISTGTLGAIQELIVAEDLLSSGYAVFRAVSPACSCDLVRLKDGKLERVEVTTGQITSLGKRTFPIHNPKDYDIIAVVWPDRLISYFPSAEAKSRASIAS